VYVECVNRGTHYRSLPFQLLEATGTKISVFVFPRTMFRFGLTVNVEDQLLAVRGRFEVSNWSWAPYRAGPDGLLVPMPQSFKGGIVIGNDQAEVSVSAGEGFRIIRPIPPGGRPFRAAYSLPIENGKVTWTSPLPMGSYQGEIDILQTPGMTVHAPDRVPNELHPSPQGTWAVLGPIAMLPGQPLTITIEGMPSPPAWRTWIPRIVGVLVILVIVAGFAFALAKKPVAVSVSNDARRQELLEQLVAIERDGGSPKRRDELLRDLEKLWG
jgi:hypothetical protein